LVIPGRPHHQAKDAEYTETKKEHHNEHKHEEKKD
jgi:hypothetical protein